MDLAKAGRNLASTTAGLFWEGKTQRGLLFPFLAKAATHCGALLRDKDKKNYVSACKTNYKFKKSYNFATKH